MQRRNQKKPGIKQPVPRQPEQINGLPEPDKRSYREAGGWLMLVHAALFFLLMLLIREFDIFSRLFSENTLESFAVSGVITQMLLVFIPSALIIVLFRLPALDIAGSKARAGSLVIAVTVGIPAAVVFQGMNNLFIYLLFRAGIRLPQRTSAVAFIQNDLFSLTGPVLLLIILVAVILPGLTEELMFRGVLQASFRSAGATGGAVFWQAVAFSLFHADPMFVLPPLMAGLLLGYIRLQSESLLPPILAHMSLNLSLLALNPLLPRLTSQYIAGSSSQATSLLYASLIAAFIAAVAFIPLLVLLSNHKRSDQDAQKKKRFIITFDWRFGLALLAMGGLMTYYW